MSAMRLSRAMIYVNDLERMIAFYRDTLGLKPLEQTRLENYLEFDAGDAIFALHSIPIAARCELPSPAPARERTPVKLSFEVQDVSAERARLESLGVRIVERPWGAYDGIDPEGNIFGICATSNGH